MSTAVAWGNQQTFLDECTNLRVEAMWCKQLDAINVRVDIKTLKRGDESYLKYVSFFSSLCVFPLGLICWCAGHWWLSC